MESFLFQTIFMLQKASISLLDNNKIIFFMLKNVFPLMKCFPKYLPVPLSLLYNYVNATKCEISDAS